MPGALDSGSRTRSTVGLVLAGGSARGAYEVGVVRYVLEDVAKALGREPPLDILCGTSAGSINTCFLAAHADRPTLRASMLADRWGSLKLEDVVRPSTAEMLHLAARLLGRTARSSTTRGRRGGILDPSGVEAIVRDAIPFARIPEQMQAGRLRAVSISTTHVASGKTVVFVQRREGGIPHWGRDPTMVGQAAYLRPDHVLASAAVPLLFPAVEVDGQFYCDGGLRQNVPLSPARRLGADRLVVVNPRYIRDVEPSPPIAEARERSYPDPLFVVGKAMNALLLDRIENDIDRLQRLNAILAAGTRQYGRGFSDTINAELGKHGLGGVRPLEVVYVRASQDIGVLAAEYVRSAEFARRSRGLLGRALRRIAEGEVEADLLSYLLFDGPFCGRLVEIGRSDAQARHGELVRFFEEALAPG
jgi:NTE family protein